MRKITKRIIVAIMTLIMLVTCITTFPTGNVKAANKTVTYNMCVGQRKTLCLKGSKSNYTFKSDNRKVVYVDKKGNMRAEKRGTAYITATNKKTREKFRYKINVKQNLQVTSEKEIKMGRNKRTQIKTNITNPIFKSSNTKVVTVDKSGSVTAKGFGEAIITVSCAKSKTKVGKNVKAQRIKVFIDAATWSVRLDRSTIQVNETTKIYGNLAGVTYRSKNPEVATVDRYGNVKAVAPGMTTIVVTSKNGYTKTAKITVKNKTEVIVSPNRKYYTFRNEATLESHYEKHGLEFSYHNANEYQDGANAVINNSRSLHKKEAEDGDDVYYLESTNEFVVVSTDGYIRTYFKPIGGKDYYDRQ